MNEAEEKRNKRIARMRDLELLETLLSDAHTADLDGHETPAFIDMLERLKTGWNLNIKQRTWAEETARRVFPVDSKDVPRGKPVPEPEALKHRPLKPPGRR